VTTKNVLVLASTFPYGDSDDKPDFVRRQVIALKRENPGINFFVLAPAEAGVKRKRKQECSYTEIRFSYFFPSSFQILTKYGILPAIKSNKLLVFLIPFFLLSEFASALITVKKEKIDYIYAHWFFPQGLIAYFVSLLTDVPFFYTSHSSDVQIMSKIPWVGKFFVRKVTRKAVGATAVSRRSLNKISFFFSRTEWERVSKKINVVPMGVDSPKNRKAGIEEHGLILFMGRLVEKKGVNFLIEALGANRDIPFKKLVIAGDGPERKRLFEISNGYKNLDKKIAFVGFVSGAKKESLLSDASLIILPSIVADNGDAEGIPVVLMEALSRGKICIATRESGADEYIEDGVNGFLVDQKNSEQIAGRIRAAMNLSVEQKRKFSEEAIRLSKTFEWSVIARRQLSAMGLESNEYFDIK